MKAIYTCAAATIVILAGVALFRPQLMTGGPRSVTTPTSIVSPAAPPDQKMHVAEHYGKLPLSFEVNQGQTDARVKFLSRGNGYSLFLTGDEAVLTSGRARPNVLRMRLLSANATAAVSGAEELPGKSNYFIGNDPKQWRTNVPSYAKVRYEDVYPGVDLVYYGNQGGQLEYDFVVAPGADPAAIRFALSAGVEAGHDSRFTIDAAGDLVVTSDSGEARFHKPVVYQEQSTADNGPSTFLDGHYVLQANHQVGFEIASYDHSKPLVIDPVLVYSTYLGGSSFDDGTAIAVDSLGNAYVTGQTTSTDFPVANALQATNNSSGGGSGGTVFVTKLTADGSALVYSTYLGGSNNELGRGIAVDASGNAYVTGETESVDFPLVNPLQAINNAASGTAFVAKLNAGGSALVYSTYLGGSNSEGGLGIAVDTSGDAYVVGTTFSGNFPTTLNAYQTAYKAATATAFVTEFNPAGSTLVYSTYLGGSVYDQGIGIALDSSGNAYVTGSTQSPDFPTVNPYQPTNNAASGTAFVAKLNAGGSTLSYSTYLGGSAFDEGLGIAVDSSASAYVTGITGSNDFPMMNAYQATNNVAAPEYTAFVTKFNAAGTALVYSTYLGGNGMTSGGGSGNDGASGIAVDSSGNAYVTGGTNSLDFPTVPPESIASISRAVFVTALNAAGNALNYSQLLGLDSTNSGSGIVVDSSGNAYVTGLVQSPDFPTVNPLQPTFGGEFDAFVAKISPVTPVSQPTTIAVPGGHSFGNSPVGDTVTGTINVRNTGHTNPLFITSVTSNDPEFAVTGTTCPTGGLAPGMICTITLAFTPSALGPHSATLSIADNDYATSAQSVHLSGTGTVDMTFSRTSLQYASDKEGFTYVNGITIYNHQTNPVSLSLPPTFSGPNASDFGVEDNTCTATLGAKSSCRVIVTYTPTQVGPESATMTVTDSPDLLGPYHISLNALAPIPESLDVSNKNFGKVPQTSTKTIMVATVTNHASVPISLSGTSFGGVNAADFAVVAGGSCPMPTGMLGAGLPCTYEVAFTPSTETVENAAFSISVMEDPAGGPPSVNLTGTGVSPLTLAPAANLGFGTHPDGHATAKTVTVTNNGSATLTISGQISGPPNFVADFRVTGGTCLLGTVAGNSNCTYTLTFTPSIVGLESATLSVSAVGDAAGPHNVSLTGTGN